MTTAKIVSLKLNLKGFQELRTSPGAKRLVNEAARKIAEACGPGYGWEEKLGRRRARAVVYPATQAARKDAAQNLTPLRKLGAARR